MAQAITVSRLSKAFGIRKALKSFDLIIPPGEVAALIGPVHEDAAQLGVSLA